ncbi:hypothetical protein BKA70DRAFT_1234823 [Coprinopsis sp. MPI-PUGE-AT-0042]|nr:hypothetical protein BKA70DRAFT_1234823 [Coprinopsis sp. MPI-PUGE-AT-0042]
MSEDVNLGPMVDASHQLYQLWQLTRSLEHSHIPPHAPLLVRSAMNVITSFYMSSTSITHSGISSTLSELRSASRSPRVSRQQPPTYPLVPQYNVKINRKTRLGTLYTYLNPTTWLEYPETSNGSVGHLFKMDPLNWIKPSQSFAYSQGEPSSRGRKVVKISILLDSRGNEVDCSVSHSNCQGIKACPLYDAMKDLEDRFEQEPLSDIASKVSSPSCLQDHELKTELLKRTLLFYQLLQAQGCNSPVAPPNASSQLDPGDEVQVLDHSDALDSRALLRLQIEQGRQGHSSRQTCSGEVIFQFDSNGKPFVRCKHYSRSSDIDHYIDYAPSHGRYHAKYLQALFEDNTDLIADFEDEFTLSSHLVPLDSCRFSTNHSSQTSIHAIAFNTLIWVIPAFVHRNDSSHLVKPQLERIDASEVFPEGTGWQGLKHWKERQQRLRPNEPYVRFMAEMSSLNLLRALDLSEEATFDDDDSVEGGPSASARSIRVVVCMSKQSRKRLLEARFVQCDTSFKRVAEFLEFELGGTDEHAKTSE